MNPFFCFKNVRRAYRLGWRAGMTEPKFMRPGGQRDILHISHPLNPYNNPFNPRRRLFLAQAWEDGRHAGRMQLLTNWCEQKRGE